MRCFASAGIHTPAEYTGSDLSYTGIFIHGTHDLSYTGFDLSYTGIFQIFPCNKPEIVSYSRVGTPLVFFQCSTRE